MKFLYKIKEWLIRNKIWTLIITGVFVATVTTISLYAIEIKTWALSNKIFATAAVSVSSVAIIAMVLYFQSIKRFVLSHKKASLIATIIAVIAIIVILIVVFKFVKPSWDYSHKEVGDTGYTQSEIEEIGDWWQEYIQGDNIYNEGNMPIDK